MEKLSMCPSEHFKAIFYRRFNKIRRSKGSLIGSAVATLVFSGLAILIYYLMVNFMVQQKQVMDFRRYPDDVTQFFFVNPPEYTANGVDTDTLSEAITSLYKQDLKKDPEIVMFPETKDLNEKLYVQNEQPTKNPAFGTGYDISSVSPYKINYYNNKSANSKTLSYNLATASRLLHRHAYGEKGDFSFLAVKLLKRFAFFVFGQMGPMLIADGLLTLIPLMITPIISDIRGEIRPYMVSCSLRLVPYWLATFLIDIICWIAITTIIWALFCAVQVRSFLDNLFSTWFILVFTGPSFLCFLYAFSFCFSSAESAARLAYLILFIILLVPVALGIIRRYEENPIWADYIFSLFPPIVIQQGLQQVCSRIGLSKQPFKFYWSDSHAQAYLIMMWVDWVLYAAILALVEFCRLKLQQRAARKAYGGFNTFFTDQKASHPVTTEAREMEELVHQDDDWAVRILDVSRLFINTAGQPIPAVNAVSLGVRRGSLFGFLGANGAGKTTLIRMITGMLPPSSGTITADGEIAICPQFNAHLDQELTPAEHLRVYALIYRLPPDTARQRSQELIHSLELEELKDKPLRELSGGDVRKLAIALCFLGPASIILLDEPTASLDSAARKGVQDLLLQLKGEKTFMLCTHILQEAEFLCDMISIMIKGSVYTVGSPQYLSQRFGTGYKIDVMLKDESEESNADCDAFFEDSLPAAVLTIKRQKARIYSIPATEITLPSLFNVMQSGVEKGCGISYYTCSSSSLERVFMEIVRMSESDDVLVGNQVDIADTEQANQIQHSANRSAMQSTNQYANQYTNQDTNQDTNQNINQNSSQNMKSNANKAKEIASSEGSASYSYSKSYDEANMP